MRHGGINVADKGNIGTSSLERATPGEDLHGDQERIHPMMAIGDEITKQQILERSKPYRSLFSGQEFKPFRGYLSKATTDKEIKDNELLLRRLASHMCQFPARFEEPNRNIPAGYTYLAQLVAHDITMFERQQTGSTGAKPDLSEPRNLVLNPLQLDCLYGGGPVHSPLLYEENRNGSRYKFKLSRGNETFASFDIPRCPFDPSAGSASYDFLPLDPLLADERNDDNLIVSQLAVLFAKFHNHVVELVAGELFGDGDISEKQGLIAFNIAREIVINVYRNIVANDLLNRLIDKKVYKKYKKKKSIDQFLSSKKGNCQDYSEIPIEFAAAAFRVGHAMIRASYNINKGQALELRRLLNEFNSRGKSMPLPSKYQIDWTRFFEIEGGGEPNFSRKISPSMSFWLYHGDEFRSLGGLVFRDLNHSLTLPLPNGQSAASILLGDEKVISPQDLEKSLLNSNYVTGHGDDANHGNDLELEKKDIEILCNDTPLLYYLLLESSLKNDGKRIGKIGSIIICETIFGIFTSKKIKPSKKISKNKILNGIVGIKDMGDLIKTIYKSDLILSIR